MTINKQKINYWLKLITITGLAQVIVQAVGFISGILVIRLLPVQEYALYTLANTMLGTMTVLSDGGISTSVKKMFYFFHSPLKPGCIAELKSILK